MLELRVLNGLHQGAVIPLDDDPVIVGGSLSADLHLVDPGVRERHLSVRPEGAGHLLVPGEGVVRNEKGGVIRGPVSVSKGQRVCVVGLWLEIQSPETPWPDPDSLPRLPEPGARGRNQKLRRFGPLPLGVAALAVTFWTLAVAQGFKSDNTDPSSGTYTRTATSQPIPVTTGDYPLSASGLPRIPEADPADSRLQSQLHRMLDERQIGEGISLTVNSDHWVLEGALPESRLPVLHRMLLRFDREFSPGFDIRNQVSAQNLELPFTIVQVSSGPFASILTDSGQRLHVGDSQSGYTLIAIESDRLVFDGPQRLAVSW